MITIGIPTYSRVVYIKNVLERCVSQSFQDIEIIVSDSSPHDGILDIVNSFPSGKIRYHRHSPDLALTPKLNDLVRQGRGEYMLILCDDDLLETDYCKVMHECTRNYPEATLFRCRYRLIDKDGHLLRLDNLCKPYMSPAEFLNRVFLRERDFFKMNISGILFPRELFLRLGGFVDLQIPWHTERIAWTMLAAYGGCVFEETPLCSVRLHPGSITSSFVHDLGASLESDKRSQKIFEDIIDEVESRTILEDEKMLLAQARENLKIYMERHLARSLDHGFLASLEGKKTTEERQLRNCSGRWAPWPCTPFRPPRCTIISACCRIPFACLFWGP